MSRWKNSNLEWLEFCKNELNQPGTLVEVVWYDSKKKPITKIFLIGDINKVCGVCDDCTAFPAEEAKVLRYRQVVEKSW